MKNSRRNHRAARLRAVPRAVACVRHGMDAAVWSALLFLVASSGCEQPAVPSEHHHAQDAGVGRGPCDDGGCVPIAGAVGCAGCESTACAVATCDGLSCAHRDRADGTECQSGVCVQGACVARRCGDGYVEPGPAPAREACDDGNTVSNDGCSAACEVEDLTIAPNGVLAERTSVAVDGTGAALVVWVAELPADDVREVRAQRLSNRGNPVGPSLAIARVPGLGTDVEIASTGRASAGWWVAWSGPSVDDDGLGIRFSAVSATGVVGPARSIAGAVRESERGDQFSPSIAEVGGALVMAFVDRVIPHENGEIGRVLLQRFDGEQAPAGIPEQLSSNGQSGAEPIIVARDSALVVAWSEGPDPEPGTSAVPFTSRVVARRWRAGAWLDVAPIVVAESRAGSPSLAWLDTGELAVGWTARAAALELRTRVLASSGAPTLGASSAVAAPAGTQSRLRLASLAQGSFLAAWNEYAQIRFGDAPSQIHPPDLERLRQALGRRAASLAMARAPRAIVVAWTEPVPGGWRLRVRLLPYADLCRQCGGDSPVCDARTGTCYECDRDGDCPVLEGSTAACVGRVCEYECRPNRADCDDDGRACEVDSRSDTAHCGGCGIACGANEICSAGVCTCAAGFTDCDGVCASLTSSVDHCGACGRSCSALPGTVAPRSCNNGTCQLTCAPNRASCDSSWTNGCEVDIGSSFDHCGVCGRRCAPGQVCVDGECECDEGLLECSGVKGCWDLESDVQHCGATCTDCTDPPGVAGVAQGTFACAAGQCGVACTAPLADCDGAWSSGCEVDLRSSAANCGSCGLSCLGRAHSTGGACAMGACQLTCERGYGDCNSSRVDGCETVTAADVANCGACGNDCRLAGSPPHVSSHYCFFGNCAIRCAVGWGDCTSASGCETPLNTVANCGACGATCGWDCESSQCNDAKAVAAGGAHTCALRDSGGVVCWGSNSSGQLGNGTTTDRTTPGPVSGLSSGVVAIAAGLSHTCALMSGGTVRCWGENSGGQLGNDSTTDQTTPVAVSGLTGVNKITAGAAHTCALLGNGTARCWGNNGFGQLGDGTTTLRRVPTVVSGLSNLMSISAGAFHTCAVRNVGRRELYCWGANMNGELGDGTRTNRSSPTIVPNMLFHSVSAGTGFTCAEETSGFAYCWGSNSSGQLGDGTTTRSSTPVPVQGLGPGGITEIRSGTSFACARQAGALFCWGANDHGQIGVGSTVDRLTAAQVSGISSGAEMLSVGTSHACAVMSTGAVRCWGANASGQVGNGSKADRLFYAPVTAP